MTSIRPAGEATGNRGTARRAGTGGAVTLLVLVTLGALIPLLGPSAALHGTGESAAPGVGGIALLRAVLFAALCVPLGELFVRRLARAVPGAPAELPRSWAVWAAGAGFAAALGPVVRFPSSARRAGPVASGACSRRAGPWASYWMYVGQGPVRRECVHGVAGQAGI